MLRAFAVCTMFYLLGSLGCDPSPTTPTKPHEAQWLANFQGEGATIRFENGVGTLVVSKRSHIFAYTDRPDRDVLREMPGGLEGLLGIWPFEFADSAPNLVVSGTALGSKQQEVLVLEATDNPHLDADGSFRVRVKQLSVTPNDTASLPPVALSQVDVQVDNASACFSMMYRCPFALATNAAGFFFGLVAAPLTLGTSLAVGSLLVPALNYLLLTESPKPGGVCLEQVCKCIDGKNPNCTEEKLAIDLAAAQKNVVATPRQQRCLLYPCAEDGTPNTVDCIGEFGGYSAFCGEPMQTDEDECMHFPCPRPGDLARDGTIRNYRFCLNSKLFAYYQKDASGMMKIAKDVAVKNTLQLCKSLKDPL